MKTPPEGEEVHSIQYGDGVMSWVGADGGLSWIHNDYGQTEPPEGETFTAITTGNWFTCALRPDGSPACWGYDSDGQSTPPEGETFTKISSGYGHTCGLHSMKRSGSTRSANSSRTARALSRPVL